MLKKINTMRIKQRLSYVFKIIIIAFSIVALGIGVLLLYMSTDYRKVLNNYAYHREILQLLKRMLQRFVLQQEVLLDIILTI